jgi:thymidine phosphorylase
MKKNETLKEIRQQIPQGLLSSFILKVKRIGIDTRKHLVIYMREDCALCKSEGFRSEARIQVSLREKWIIATLNVVTSEILKNHEIGLSESALERLGANEGDVVVVSHANPLDSYTVLPFHGCNIFYP